MADRSNPKESTKAQSVRLKLSHSHDFETHTTGFRPLSLPDTGELLLEQLSADSIESLTANVHVRLRSGTYGLPLTQGEVCVVEINGGCSLELNIAVEPSPDGPMVRSVSGHFNKPIVFTNILSTLDEIRELFQDRLFGRVAETSLQRLSSTPGLRWLSAAPKHVASKLSQLTRERTGASPFEWLKVAKELAKHQLDELTGDVHLTGFAARPVKRQGEWHLAFSFDGEVNLVGELQIPFRRITVPRFILPTLHADLTRLLSASPLASASISFSKVPLEQLSRELSRLLSKFELSFELSGRVPTLEVESETFNRGRLLARLEVPGRLEVAGVVKGGLKDGELAIHVEQLKLELDGKGVELEAKARFPKDELLDLILPAALDGNPDRLRFALPVLAADLANPRASVQVEIRSGSSFPAAHFATSLSHAFARGETHLAGDVSTLTLSGTLSAGFDMVSRTWVPEKIALDYGVALEILDGGFVEDGVSSFTPKKLDAQMAGTVSWSSDEPLHLVAQGQVDLAVEGQVPLDPIPELNIPGGHLLTELEASLELSANVQADLDDDGCFVVSFDKTRTQLSLGRCALSHADLCLQIPAGTTLDLEVTDGRLSTSGLGKLETRVNWDMQGRSATLSRGAHHAELFVDELRAMQAVAQISPTGHLSFKGSRSDNGNPLYDGAFLNALVNPGVETQKWLDILEDDQAMDFLLKTLAVLSQEVADWAAKARRAVVRAQKIVREEGVNKPADLIPREKMAKVVSLLLTGTDAVVERIAPIVQGVTEARGLDRRAIEAIIEEYYPDHGFELEVVRGLKWLDHVLAPGDPVSAPTRQAITPLASRPEYAKMLRDVPSAAEMYRVVGRSGAFPDGFSRKVADLAPYLGLKQLGALIDTGGKRWSASELGRLRTIQELKKRMRSIAAGFGGLGYAPQATAIAFFLGEVIASDLAMATPDQTFPPRGILGPEDVAVLLQAGLASSGLNRVIQINQRMLLEIIKRHEPDFFVGVLVEMSFNSPRILTSMLLSLLNQSQLHIQEPFDLPQFFSNHLDIEIPNRDDYMAGGRWAKESYYKALTSTAEYILSRGNVYLARKNHLQRYRHAAPTLPRESTAVELVAKAQQAILAADELGRKCRFDGALDLEGPLSEAKAGYLEAFAACRALMDADPMAFHLGFFKEFWARNHEALVVLSVVRDLQENTDRTRNWLTTRAGYDDFNDEQGMLRATIETLYHFPDDHRRLLDDPLVRLLIDPPEGRYDFSIVSAMGVVTDGAAGVELAGTFERLQKKRGITTVRADTATAETLEYNALRIEEAIDQVEGPFGMIGYSQGCANVLRAETMLREGTPAQQAVISRLKSRNFICSAINGSAHGTCGNLKFIDAMVEGEHIIKFYQAVFSSTAIRAFQKALSQALDSRIFSHVMGSVESLSYEGVMQLGREGQFLTNVPTSTIRGIVTEEILPEALEFLSHVFDRQVMGEPHDTQVLVDTAVGYPTWVDNENSRALESCDMGSLVQTLHHWSPLAETTEFITTERDRKRAIYDLPKDRHVMPWIEVNARFGVIKTVKP